MSQKAPFLVAHRAGNELTLLRRAERLPVRLVEADVYLYANRLEVRHLKTAGPLPILWDRWRLASPWRPRLELETLLQAASPTTELMLDLKGRDLRLSGRISDAIAKHAAGRRLTVCSQRWELLEPLDDLDNVRVVHSVGGARGLAALRRRFEGQRLAGVSIHRKLLDPDVVADLRRRAAIVMTWPVSSAEEARTLAGWGVDGLITDRFEELAGSLRAA